MKNLYNMVNKIMVNKIMVNKNQNILTCLNMLNIIVNKMSQSKKNVI